MQLLSKLRAINLLEADFNMGTKTLLGQGVMKHATNHKLVPQFQYATKITKQSSQPQ